jgi:phosphoglycerate-specific signal transduction histidine kinase
MKPRKYDPGKIIARKIGATWELIGKLNEQRRKVNESLAAQSNCVSPKQRQRLERLLSDIERKGNKLRENIKYMRLRQRAIGI